MNLGPTKADKKFFMEMRKKMRDANILDYQWIKHQE